MSHLNPYTWTILVFVGLWAYIGLALTVAQLLARASGCTCMRHWVDSRCPKHGWR